MGKTILAVALVAVAIAVPFVAPEIAGAIGLTAAIGATAATAVVTAALEIGVALANSALLGPGSVKALNTNPIQRLYATLETTTPRKILFGNTAGATDVRYQSYTGTSQQYYNQIVVVASHQVNSIYELWIDNEIAWSSASGVQGRYVGWLTVTAITLGTSANGIAIDGTWTSSCTLTGCAYIYAQYLLVGSDNSKTSPFQGGVSTRLTIRTKGASVYDPRLDSTVAGGSGTQRAATQSTWAWNDNGSRNPALQLLFYLLGWRESVSGKLMVGMGIPAARIDLPSFITAANICDESVSLKGGGSEPRYRSDGVLSEGDDRQAVIDALCASMNATLRDAGGKISIQVLHDDTATPTMDFSDTDIIGGEEWAQTPALTQYHNIVRGKCVDPSNNALYQMTDYPAQSLTSPDGIDRIDAIDYPMVQSHTQAQRLAKLRLMRSQYQGQYSATVGARGWGVSIGNIVRLSHTGLSFTNKLFRVVSQQITRLGQIKLGLLEENAAIYVWTPSTDEKTGVAAGTPPIANPALNPLLTVDQQIILRNSYPTGLSLSATDAGTSATINISACTMQYATSPPTAVSWPSHSITGLAYNTLYYIYADVSAVGSNSPTYGATTSYGTALNSSTNPGRIFLNQSITTPASGGSGTSGTSFGGGYGGGGAIP